MLLADSLRFFRNDSFGFQDAESLFDQSLRLIVFNDSLGLPDTPDQISQLIRASKLLF